MAARLLANVNFPCRFYLRSLPSKAVITDNFKLLTYSHNNGIHRIHLNSPKTRYSSEWSTLFICRNRRRFISTGMLYQLKCWGNYRQLWKEWMKFKMLAASFFLQKAKCFLLATISRSWYILFIQICFVVFFYCNNSPFSDKRNVKTPPRVGFHHMHRTDETLTRLPSPCGGQGEWHWS